MSHLFEAKPKLMPKDLADDLENEEDPVYPIVSTPLAQAQPLLPTGKPKGPLTKAGQEAKAWSRKFVDDPRWDKMIWFWIENPEMMPPGVFATIMFYRYGKPPQTIKVKGEIMARPYLGEGPEVLARRARQLADRLSTLAKLNDAPANAKLVGPGSSGKTTK
jgi:hypothetical protein